MFFRYFEFNQILNQFLKLNLLEFLLLLKLGQFLNYSTIIIFINSIIFIYNYY